MKLNQLAHQGERVFLLDKGESSRQQKKNATFTLPLLMILQRYWAGKQAVLRPLEASNSTTIGRLQIGRFDSVTRNRKLSTFHRLIGLLRGTRFVIRNSDHDDGHISDTLSKTKEEKGIYRIFVTFTFPDIDLSSRSCQSEPAFLYPRRGFQPRPATS